MSGPVFWSDVSEFQVPVDDSYPYPVLAIRSNDGTYRDTHFAQNYAWGKAALASGRLRILIVYCVWRSNWAQTADIHTSMIGDPAPAGVVSMLDVESWGGQITGNQSAGINAARDRIAASAYGGDHRRVIGYGNSGDLASLWPQRSADQRLIVAAYGSNPTVAGEIGHQFTDGQYGGPITVPPFGRDDVNDSHGLTLDQLAASVGLGAGSAATSEVETVIQQFPVVGDGVLELNPMCGSASGLYSAAWVSVRSSQGGGACDVWWGLSDKGGRGEKHWGPAGRPAPGSADGELVANERRWTPLTTTDGVDQATIHYFLGDGVSGCITLEMKP